MIFGWLKNVVTRFTTDYFAVGIYTRVFVESMAADRDSGFARDSLLAYRDRMA